MIYNPQTIISLPLSGEPSNKVVYAKQGDKNSRFLKVVFVSWEGIIASIPSTASITARAKTTSGYSYDCKCVISDNKYITIQLRDEAMQEAGTVVIDVVVKEGDEILSSSTFILKVTESASSLKGASYPKPQNLQIKKLSQAEYNAIDVKDDNTIYYVESDTDGTVREYLGSKQTVAAPALPAQSHRDTFRGDNLIAKGYSISQICKMIEEGNFDDIYIGDYIPMSGTFSVPVPKLEDGATSIETKTVTYSTKMRVAGINTYLATGATLFNQNHVVIIPDDILYVTPLYAAGKVLNGLKGTFFYTQQKDYLETHLINQFGGADANKHTHLLKHSVQLSSKVDSSLASMAGAGNVGASTGSEISDERVVLPSEIEIFGSLMCTSSAIDVGFANRQLPLFRIAPEFITKQRQYYWLSAVANSQSFGFVDADGASSYTAATYGDNIGIRPILVIG